MIKKLPLLFFLLIRIGYASAQQVTPTAEQIKALTPDWEGERFSDGRPKVSDKILDRLKDVALEKHGGYSEIKVIKISMKEIGWY